MSRFISIFFFSRYVADVFSGVQFENVTLNSSFVEEEAVVATGGAAHAVFEVNRKLTLCVYSAV